MTTGLSAVSGGSSLPPEVLAGVDEKLSNSVFGKVLQDYAMGDIKLTMWIPSDLAGKVIGKKGIVIQTLQRESKSKLINALPRVGDSLWIAVVIIGEVKSVFDAGKSISEIVDGEVDDVVFEFTINYRKPFFLFGGKKFGIIRTISADTNVRIFFPEFNPKVQPFKEALPVTLEGNMANVRKAVGMFEREALFYQYHQAHRTENRDTDSVSTGASSRNEVKTGRRAVLTTAPATAPAAKEVGAKKSAPLVNSATAAAAVAAPGKKATAEAAAVSEPKLKPTPAPTSALSEAANTAQSAQPSAEPATADGEPHQTETAAPTGPGSDAANGSGEVDYTSKYGGRQVEKFINVPTSLVGLLLSKRPKAKSTTINQMQVMTHTIISKMLPSGVGAASGEGTEGAEGAVASAVEGGPADPADATAGSADEDGANDPVAVTEREEAGDGVEEGPGEGQEESSDEESDSDDESESSDDGEEHGEGTGGAPKEGQEGQQEAGTTSVPKSAAERAEDDVKRRAIAESERLGYVVFRVLGYHEENVDTVISALQEIIDGERIGQVCEKLKVTAQKLQWPPNRLPPKWLRQKSEGGEVKPRKERPTKPRDPTVRPKSSRLRRTDDQGEGAGAASGEGAEDGVEGGAVSSRYKGKSPRPSRGPPRESREGGNKERKARPPRDSHTSGPSAVTEA